MVVVAENIDDVVFTRGGCESPWDEEHLVVLTHEGRFRRAEVSSRRTRAGFVRLIVEDRAWDLRLPADQCVLAARTGEPVETAQWLPAAELTAHHVVFGPSRIEAPAEAMNANLRRVMADMIAGRVSWAEADRLHASGLLRPFRLSESDRLEYIAAVVNARLARREFWPEDFEGQVDQIALAYLWPDDALVLSALLDTFGVGSSHEQHDGKVVVLADVSLVALLGDRCTREELKSGLTTTPPTPPAEPLRARAVLGADLEQGHGEAVLELEVQQDHSYVLCGVIVGDRTRFA